MICSTCSLTITENFCPTTRRPVIQYLKSRPDVVKSTLVDNRDKGNIKSEYVLNLKTEDIGNKFIEVYKEAQRICADCHKQVREK